MKKYPSIQLLGKCISESGNGIAAIPLYQASAHFFSNESVCGPEHNQRLI